MTVIVVVCSDTAFSYKLFACLQMTTSHEPHFFKPLLPGFHTGVTIPLEFFSKHIQGSEKNKPWKLRSDASDQVWEVIREGRTLTKGWKEFATAHDLRIGDIVIFKHEGDLVFHLTPFGPSCCEIQYTNPHNVKEEADADDAPSFSFDYCFLAEVTTTNQKEDQLVSKLLFLCLCLFYLCLFYFCVCSFFLWKLCGVLL